MNASAARAEDWPRLVRGLYSVAIAVFLVTVGIGIVNGLDLVDFSPPEMRNTLLTHVHSGTLGWITLSIIAATMWLARDGNRWLAVAFGVLIPVYVAAFYSGNYPARAGFGVLLLLAIVWLFVWAWQVALADRSFPKVAVALGLTTFTYGAIIGVLIQVQGAIGTAVFPQGSDAIGAHAATMVFSYLILVAMGLIEWQLRGTTDLPRGALVQVGALFLGGLLLALAALFLGLEGTQSIAGLYLLLELIAVVVFAVRILPAALRVDWVAATPRRHIATSALFVVVAMLLFMYFVFRFLAAGPDVDFAALPIGILTASDHATFIGVMTNFTFAMALTLAADRRSLWPWADQAVYWIVNVGLVLFLIGLAGESAEIKRIGAPTMGVGILLGLATIAARLWSSNLPVPTMETGEPQPAMPEVAAGA
jgi:hypothetical protein